MGLFKSLRKRSAPEPDIQMPEGFPDLFNGMKVEVLTPDNILLFVGRLQIMGSDLLEIRSKEGTPLPRAVYNQQVKLHVFHKDGTSSTLNGAVGANSHVFWRIERLRHLQSSESRAFFRLPFTGDGWAYSDDSNKGSRYPCKILDISAGGARIAVDTVYKLYANFLLEITLLPSEDPFSIICQVRRADSHAKRTGMGKQFEYGCQFMEMPSGEQDRLLQAIFTLQRKLLRSRREAEQ